MLQVREALFAKKILRILVASQIMWPDLCFVSQPQQILNTLVSTKYTSAVLKISSFIISL